MERQEQAAQRIAERLRRALARDAAGALAPLPFPLQPNLTPRRLPGLEPVDLNPEQPMSLHDWAKAGWLRPHQTSRRQIADLFAIVDRDLVARTSNL